MKGKIGALQYPLEYYVYDGQGNVVATTDLNGQVHQRTAYDAFGRIVAQSGDSDNGRLRTTKERSQTLGLDNDGFRYYSAETGRYVTRDPLGYRDGMNVYVSVHNDPVNKVDPLGLNSIESNSRDRLPSQVADTLERNMSNGGVWIPPADDGPQLRSGPGIPIHEPSRAANLLSFGLDMVPFVGNVKSGSEFISGRDGVTGEQLGWVARTVGLAGVILPQAKGPIGRVIRWIGGHAEEAKDVTRMVKLGEIKWTKESAKVAEEGANNVAGVAAEGAVSAETKGGTYLLRDVETDQVMRTGRSNDLARRQAEHARDIDLKDYQFEPVHRTDSYLEQRGLEQYLHNQYNPPLNKVNPISPANPRRQNYMDAAQDVLDRQGGQ